MVVSLIGLKSKLLNNIFVKASSGYFLSNLLLKSTAILTAPIFTRLLSPSDYGITANFLAWANILSIFVGLGLPYTVGNAKNDFPHKLMQYITSIQILSSLAGLMALTIAIIMRRQLSNLLELDSRLIVLIFVYILFLPPVVLFQEIYKYELKYKNNIYISVFNVVGGVILCLLLIIFVFNNVRYYGRIIGMILPMFLMGIYFYRIMFQTRAENIKKYWSYSLRIAIPMIPHSIGMAAITQIDRIMIFNITGSAASGFYSFGFSFAVLITLFSGAIMQTYQPILYERLKSNDFETIKNINTLVLATVSFVAIIIIGIGPEVIKLLGSKEFEQSKIVIPPLVIGFLFQFIYFSFSMIVSFYKRTTYIALGTILTGIVNIVFNYVFIPKWGYFGAAAATTISYLMLVIYHMIIAKHIAGEHVYNYRYIWYQMLSASIAGVVIMQFYDDIISRYATIIIILIFYVIFQKNYLLIIFKNIMKKQAIWTG